MLTCQFWNSSGLSFHDVLGISQQPGRLNLCTSLLQSRLAGEWANIDAVACCESGGFVFASPLALQVDAPLLLVGEGGKLPPPTYSVPKPASNISSAIRVSGDRKGTFEIGRNLISEG